jgi:hypothetical protein
MEGSRGMTKWKGNRRPEITKNKARTLKAVFWKEALLDLLYTLAFTISDHKKWPIATNFGL